jgi:hypothetical protein
MWSKEPQVGGGGGRGGGEGRGGGRGEGGEGGCMELSVKNKFLTQYLRSLDRRNKENSFAGFRRKKEKSFAGGGESVCVKKEVSSAISLFPPNLK